MSEFEKIVQFLPAYDQRHSDANKNYGIGAAKISMALKGAKGAVEFVLDTGWFFPSTDYERGPVPTCICYHSPVPMRSEQRPIVSYCEFLDDRCYCDGSASGADEVFDILVRQGGDGVWQYLEKYYRDIFGEVIE